MAQVTARRWVVDRRARLMVALAGGLALVFVLLAMVLRQAAGTPLDLAVTIAIQWIDNAAFSPLMVAISAPGFWPWSGLILGVATVGFFLAGFRRAALFLLATPGANALSAFAKLVVERPRPLGEGVHVTSTLLDFSYPSGHVVGYVSFYGFLYFLIYVHFKRSGWRSVALVVLGLLVGLIGVSRIYLGHHWVSDVLGGYALGGVYLLVMVEAYRATTIEPAVRAGEPVVDP